MLFAQPFGVKKDVVRSVTTHLVEVVEISFQHFKQVVDGRFQQ